MIIPKTPRMASLTFVPFFQATFTDILKQLGMYKLWTFIIIIIIWKKL